MKNKFLLSVMFVIIIVGFYIPNSYSQYPTYTMTLANDAQTASNVYEFDVYLLQTGTDAFHLFGVQAKLGITTAALNGGTLTPTWVSGSNDAVLVTANQVNTLSATTTYVRIITAANTASYGSSAIISNVPPGTKLGRLRLTNSVTFATQALNIAWLFTTPFATNVVAYNDDGSGLNTAITDQANHLFSNFGNPILPIELTTFVSNVSGRQVNLSWATKTEINSNKYEIERALVSTKDAKVTWVSVGVVPASGSSNSPKNYSYTEKDLQAGKYQYRLKMIDNNGSYKYSDVVETEIALPKNFELSQNYPNPFNPTTRINYNLAFDSRVTIEVYDITGERMGQIVNEEQSAGYYTVNFNSSTLNRSIASGVYIYRIIAVNKSNGNVFSSNKKMMLLK